MLNRIILIGRLTRDPEMRYTGSGTAFTRFTLAVDRPYKDQNGEKMTDFINIVTWRKLAEHCAQYLYKGRLVAVEGSLQINKREKDGRTYINPDVVADSVKFLEWPRENQGQEQADDDFSDIKEYIDDADLPF